MWATCKAYVPIARLRSASDCRCFFKGKSKQLPKHWGLGFESCSAFSIECCWQQLSMPMKRCETDHLVVIFYKTDKRVVRSTKKEASWPRGHHRLHLLRYSRVKIGICSIATARRQLLLCYRDGRAYENNLQLANRCRYEKNTCHICYLQLRGNYIIAQTKIYACKRRHRRNS